LKKKKNEKNKLNNIFFHGIELFIISRFGILGNNQITRSNKNIILANSKVYRITTVTIIYFNVTSKTDY